MSTIFALASATGRAGLSVIRISGNGTKSILKNLIPEMHQKIIDNPRRLFKSSITDNGDIIDEGMVVFFKSPNSFTGEDVTELHLHGSPAVIDASYKTLSRLGLSLAKPGEFSQRALLNGKLSMNQVEALADLVQAETEQQRKMAISGYSGERLRDTLLSWQKELTINQARLEAWIDFAEDEQIDASQSLAKVIADLDDLLDMMRARLEIDKDSELVRSGINMVIAGPPNSGKSSLLNRLVGRKASIVSSIPGTTRDIIQCSLNIGGHLVNVLDTAGIRNDTRDVIEMEGINLARSAIEKAHIVLLLDDGFASINLDVNQDKLIRVHSKADLRYKPDSNAWALSVLDEQIYSEFHDRLTRWLNNRLKTMSTETPLLTRARHRHCLQSAIKLIEDALHSIDRGDVVLASESLRRSSMELGRITGHTVNHEQVLDALFSAFCIGK